MRRYAGGEEIDTLEVEEAAGPLAGLGESARGVHVEHGQYGYCTNFLLVGGGWDFDEVRARMAALGDSAVIVGDDDLVKVHIHTETPGTVLNYATALGSLRQISITNMQDQHEDFLDMHAEGNSHIPPELQAAGVRGSSHNAGLVTAQNRIAVLAVATGA